MVLVNGAVVSDVFLHVGHEVHRPHVQVLVVREDDDEIRSPTPVHGPDEQEKQQPGPAGALSGRAVCHIQ